MSNRTYRSVAELEEALFPRWARRKRQEGMSTEELAREMARESLEEIRKTLRAVEGKG